MAAKRIRVSDDNGSTWYTLPGNSGEMQDEMGQIVDTTFGQNFESNEAGLINWNIQSNALYKGFAGYVASIKSISGVSIAAAGEAVTDLGGGKYQITNPAHQILDRVAGVTVKDGASDVSDDVVSIDYLNGIITLPAPASGTVTVDVNYFNTSVIAKGQSFTLTQTAEAIQNTDFETAQANNGHHTFEQGLQRVQLEIQGVYATTNAFRAALIARSEVIVELAPSGALTGSYCRGFFKRTSRGQSGDVGALEEETVSFSLSVPDDDLIETPFKWVHPNTTTLNTSVRKCLNAWENRTGIKAQYLPDGVKGYAGDCVVTEMSLSGGLEQMNEFTVHLQGTGAATAVV